MRNLPASAVCTSLCIAVDNHRITTPLSAHGLLRSPTTWAQTPFHALVIRPLDPSSSTANLGYFNQLIQTYTPFTQVL